MCVHTHECKDVHVSACIDKVHHYFIILIPLARDRHFLAFSHQASCLIMRQMYLIIPKQYAKMIHNVLNDS
jgi:hypothetical protein